jgi:glycogen synthase
MAKHYEVLQMLIPNGGYVQTGETWEGIQFIDCEPITKKQYTDGFAQYDAWKAEQDAAKAQSKAALLERLGLSQEEFNTLTA